jgi:hypothetical protein
MTPGPKEPNAEELQHALKVVVDDLLELYNHGIRISTPQYPDGNLLPPTGPFAQISAIGRLVKVILLAIVCDHPAMCKMGGFSDHSHNQAPCTKCTVTQDELFSERSLRNCECIHYLFVYQ